MTGLVKTIIKAHQLEDIVVIESELITTSGILQTQITSNDGDISTLDTKIDTTSGTLQTQFDNLDLDYATDAQLTGVSGVLQTQITTNNSGIAAHAASDGSSHTFIDQDVTTSGNPTFTAVYGSHYSDFELGYPNTAPLDDGQSELEIFGCTAHADSTVNYRGGNIGMYAGYGARNYAGAARGGAVFLEGGSGYGTGDGGNIEINAGIARGSGHNGVILNTIINEIFKQESKSKALAIIEQNKRFIKQIEDRNFAPKNIMTGHTTVEGQDNINNLKDFKSGVTRKQHMKTSTFSDWFK